METLGKTWNFDGTSIKIGTELTNIEKKRKFIKNHHFCKIMWKKHKKSSFLLIFGIFGKNAILTRKNDKNMVLQWNASNNHYTSWKEHEFKSYKKKFFWSWATFFGFWTIWKYAFLGNFFFLTKIFWANTFMFSPLHTWETDKVPKNFKNE